MSTTEVSANKCEDSQLKEIKGGQLTSNVSLNPIFVFSPVSFFVLCFGFFKLSVSESLFFVCLFSDGHRCCGADNRSAGPDHSTTHDSSSREAAPVGVF